MLYQLLWLSQAPLLPAVTQSRLTQAGSLTARLKRTGVHPAVRILRQGPDAYLEDERSELGLKGDTQLQTREVAPTLNDTPVVFSRSVSRIDCPMWQPILGEVSCSLSLTLFSDLSGLLQESLRYCLITTEHPQFAPAARLSPHTSYPARRCRVMLREAPQMACELFLPALENLLR